MLHSFFPDQYKTIGTKEKNECIKYTMKYRFRKAETGLVKKNAKPLSNQGFTALKKMFGNILRFSYIGGNGSLWQTVVSI
ncbi:hypothetical protein BTA31_06000 [Bacillus haynesii]|uniref:Transposase n=1 Tax=Bacillus haynesii TaxID=1925021 RepID=A0ABX3I5L8_9BACI|nr:hypothetical protein BTA31_06000 [Bacillus haynesii]